MKLTLNNFADTIRHSDTTLNRHLESTGNILEIWGANSDIVNAAKYHTIYFTESFQFQFSIPLSERSGVAEEIGKNAEKLLFLYAHRNSAWLNQRVTDFEKGLLTIGSFYMPLRNSLGCEYVTLNDLKCVVAIILANAIEQAPRQPLLEYNQFYWLSLGKFCSEVLPKLQLDLPLISYGAVEKDAAIPQLPELFAWKNISSINDPTERFDKICSKRFRKLLSTVDEILLSPIPCCFLYNKLSALSKMNCALSPKILALYLTPNKKISNKDCLKVYNWIKAQAIAENIIENDPCKSASADDQFNFNSKKNELVKAPVTIANIPLDISNSDYDEIWLKGNHTPDILAYSNFDAAILREKIDYTFSYINEVDANVVRFIVNAVRLISLRKDNLHISSHGSSSWPNYPGLIGLINIHKDEIPIEKAVSGIIHEAIHNYLYQIEIFTPFSADTNRFYNLKACSPWTGRELHLASFIHASFVWFGLFNFWVIRLKTLGKDETVISEREKAERGFAKEEYLVEINRNKRYIRPDVFSILLQLREIVLSTTI